MRLVAFAAGMVLAMAASAQEDLTGGIEWRTDLDAARAEARQAGRPMLVVFR